MRLIDAESPQNRMYVSDLVIKEMKKIPTVEIDRPTSSQFKRMAVQLGYEPVVRCKDCKSGKYWTNSFGIIGFKCNLFCADISPEAFCSHGERKDDAHEPMGA